MPFSLKTDDLPVSDRPPLAYHATVASFELRTSQNSGEPNINITLMTPTGKRFDRIAMKRHWFEPSFDPNKITDTKERNLFFLSVGAKNRIGKVRRYLGMEVEAEFNSPEELAATLNEHAVGKKFIVVEQQQKDENGHATDNYNLNLYDEDRPPKSYPEGTRNMLDQEPKAAQPTATPITQ